MLRPNYPCPQTAVVLRRLAWEMSLLKGDLSRKGLVGYINEVRTELGMTPYSGGAGSAFIDKLKKQGHIAQSAEPPTWHLLSRHWNEAKNWRILNAPNHGDVRRLATGAVCIKTSAYSSPAYRNTLYFRDSMLPPLEVWLQNGCNPSLMELENLNHRHVLYMFCYPQAGEGDTLTENGVVSLGNLLYVGETYEFPTRMRIHCRNAPQLTWAAAFSLADPQYQASLSTDARKVAESLLICFFDEIAKVGNSEWGHDVKPHFGYFQQGVALATAAAAALVWLASQPKEFPVALPFKAINLPDWSNGQSYLKPWTRRLN